MGFVETTLGIPPDVQQGLDTGAFYRDGGVVREVPTGRIVALLRDVDVGRDAVSELLGPLLPLALTGALDARAARASAQLQVLTSEVRGVQGALAADSARADGLLLGDALAHVGGVHLDLAVGDVAKALARTEALRASTVRLHTAAAALAASPAAFRADAEGFTRIVRAMLLTGSLTLEVLVRGGDVARARFVARALATASAGLDAALTGLLRRPGTQFWVAPQHRRALLEVRAASRRLLAWHDALAQGLLRQLQALAALPAAGHDVALEVATAAARRPCPPGGR